FGIGPQLVSGTPELFFNFVVIGRHYLDLLILINKLHGLIKGPDNKNGKKVSFYLLRLLRLKSIKIYTCK
ncbi:MAG: hypothetical protein ACE5JB_09020, partial [bacterium]